MNKQENGQLSSIAKHVATLNKEVGRLDKKLIKCVNDISWIKWLIMALFVALIINKFYL